MPANSFATFFKAVYPDQAQVLTTSGPYGDPVNVYSAGTVVPGGGGGGDATAANQQLILNAIAAMDVKVDDLDSDVVLVQATVDSIETDSDALATTLQVDGFGGHQFTSLALENTPSTAGGSGLYQVTVTVQDESLDALQGARVNIDGTVLTLTTPSSGEVVFNLDPGIYTINVSPPAGYDTPVGQVATITTSDTGKTFTLSLTDPGGGGPCEVPWL